MINIIDYQFLPVSRFFVPNRNKQPFVIVFFQKLTAETYIHSYSLTSQHHVISNLSISIIHAFQKKKRSMRNEVQLVETSLIILIHVPAGDETIRLDSENSGRNQGFIG